MAEQLPRILIVDDESDLAVGLKLYFRRRQFEVETAASAEQALERIRQSPPQLVITDLMLPGMSGLELLKHLKEQWPELFVVLITGYATVETAVQAIREGAFDYIAKPFTPQQLEVVVNRVFQHKALADENQTLKARLAESRALAGLVGQSEAMKKVQALIAKVAPSDASVLIIGESGTGKEVVARALHAHSRRSERPFIPVDCAALPHNLMESELFGYERGAFTGATGSRAGLLEAADTGTFFMDELGELELSMQVKLLRVLQERQFRRVGGARMTSVNVRFVAATNRDLEKEVKAGRFREDLYHRLNVVQLRLPPLRERAGDVPLLAYHFLQVHAARLGREGCRLTSEAIQALDAYDWPGNVRELQNAIEYAVSITDGPVIRVDDLPYSILSRVRPPRTVVSAGVVSSGAVSAGAVSSGGVTSGAASSGATPLIEAGGLQLVSGPEPLQVRSDLPYKQAKRLWLEVFEKEYFGELLRRHDYNVSHAARAAEIDRKSIRRIMKRSSGEGGSEGGRGDDDDD